LKKVSLVLVIVILVNFVFSVKAEASSHAFDSVVASILAWAIAFEGVKILTTDSAKALATKCFNSLSNASKAVLFSARDAVELGVTSLVLTAGLRGDIRRFINEDL